MSILKDVEYVYAVSYIKTMENSIKNKHQQAKLNFAQNVAKLDTLSPLKTLTRGFSITEKDGKIVKSTSDLQKEDKINIKFFDGEKQAKIL